MGKIIFIGKKNKRKFIHKKKMGNEKENWMGWEKIVKEHER